VFRKHPRELRKEKGGKGHSGLTSALHRTRTGVLPLFRELYSFASPLRAVSFVR
jgi:hypothetical protein